LSTGIDAYFGRIGALFTWQKAEQKSFTPRLNRDPRDKRRKGKINCGDGRFKPEQRNAYFFAKTGAGINFRIDWEVLKGSLVFPSYEIAFLQPNGPTIMYHKDPEPSRCKWPDHALRHVQLAGLDPQSFWHWVRLPCFFTDDQTGDDPFRLLEYFSFLAERTWSSAGAQ